MKEDIFLLGRYKSLVGVYTPMSSKDSATKNNVNNVVVVFLNSGLIHHVGPHRLYVKLARILSKLGISALRVDQSGIGDSSVRPDSLPAQEYATQEVSEILDELKQHGHNKIILCGICSGASLAVQTAFVDKRVDGVVLINTAADTSNTDLNPQMSAQYYIRRSLWNPKAWVNLFTGRVNYRLLFNSLLPALRSMFAVGKNKTSMVEAARQGLESAMAIGAKLLVVLSDRDAQAFELISDGVADLQQSGQLQIKIFPSADHLFTSLHDQDVLIKLVCDWAEGFQSENDSAEPA